MTMGGILDLQTSELPDQYLFMNVAYYYLQIHLL